MQHTTPPFASDRSAEFTKKKSTSPRRRRHEGPIPAVDTAEAAEELGIEVLRQGCGRCGGEAVGVTLPETNIAHENRPLQKEIPIGNHHF